MVACLASYPGFLAIAFAAYGTKKVSRCYGRKRWSEKAWIWVWYLSYILTASKNCVFGFYYRAVLDPVLVYLHFVCNLRFACKELIPSHFWRKFSPFYTRFINHFWPVSPPKFKPFRPKFNSFSSSTTFNHFSPISILNQFQLNSQFFILT